MMQINLQLFLLVSLVMGMLITLLLLINALFAKMIAAKARYVMWIIIMLGLIIPLRPIIGDGVIDMPDFAVASSEFTERLPLENNSVEPVEMPTPLPDVSNQDAPTANEQPSLQTMIFAIWLVVAIGIIGYHLFQYIRFQRTIKRWGELEEDKHTLALFDQVKQEMNLGSSKVQLIVCGFISTSMLTGFFKPIILLPERNYDDAELELIFRHELIHYRRKDLWIKFLSVVAIAVHWFNPLVYLMNIALQTEGEASCDQEVLEMSKLKNRQFYAEVIIGMIGGKRSGMTTFATNFYGGKKGIKKRLEEIISGAAPHKSISYALLALISLLTIMSGSVFAMPTSTSAEQGIIETTTESDADFFELAITAVGGGTVVEYDQLSSALRLIHVAYGNDIYLVEVDTIRQLVVGLSIQRGTMEPPTQDNNNETDEPSETDTDENPVEPTTDLPQEASSVSEISSEQAVDIAMGVAPGRLVEVSRDWENGRPAWWIEIRHNGMVHEFYIDMETGTILQHEFEIDD